MPLTPALQTSLTTLSALCANSSFSRLSRCATQALSRSSSSWNWAIVTSRFSSTAFSICSSALSLVFSSSVLRRWAYTYVITETKKNGHRLAFVFRSQTHLTIHRDFYYLVEVPLILLILQLVLKTVSLCCQLLQTITQTGKNKSENKLSSADLSN